MSDPTNEELFEVIKEQNKQIKHLTTMIDNHNQFIAQISSISNTNTQSIRTIGEVIKSIQLEVNNLLWVKHEHPIEPKKSFLKLFFEQFKEKK
jgi:DNA repair protein RadC